MSRRGNNEGTIKLRTDGRWEARIALPGGRRKSFYGKTRKDVAQQLAAASRDRDKGLPIVTERQTVDQFLTNWLSNVKGTIRPRTWRRYEQFIRVHALPRLGATTLTRLTPQQVQSFYADLLVADMAPTSVLHLHMVLHRAFNQALRFDLVQRNIFDLVDPPHMPRPEMQVWTPSQARQFLRNTAGSPFEALYTLALTTGMRQGELLALRWRDVELDGGFLQVRTTIHREPEGWTFAEPKTMRSRRKIALNRTAVAALSRHRARQTEFRSQVGLAWQDLDLVFPNELGRPIEAGNLVRRSFQPLLQQAGVPRILFHDLRHTAATLLLLQDVHPKVVSEMLGHASVSITLDLYSHVLPDMQRQATSAMDRIFDDSGDAGEVNPK